MDKQDTGILLNPNNIKINRFHFRQMVKLIGINVIYRAPREEHKEYSLHGELQPMIDVLYYEPESVGCIFNEHTDQKTMKKLGWNAERDESTPVIHVPYDLKGLQAGALFIIPSGLDKADGRVFKVLDMSNIAVYPASIACKLGPVLKNEFEQSQLHDFTHNTMTLVREPEEDEDE